MDAITAAGQRGPREPPLAVAPATPPVVVPWLVPVVPVVPVVAVVAVPVVARVVELVAVVVDPVGVARVVVRPAVVVLELRVVVVVVVVPRVELVEPVVDPAEPVEVLLVVEAAIVVDEPVVVDVAGAGCRSSHAESAARSCGAAGSLRMKSPLCLLWPFVHAANGIVNATNGCVFDPVAWQTIR